MQYINRLLIQARKMANPAICNALCFIEHDEERNKWCVIPQLWDGVSGSGFMEGVISADFVREYDSEEEACSSARTLFDSLGIPENDTLIFTMDYGDLED